MKKRFWKQTLGLILAIIICASGPATYAAESTEALNQNETTVSVSQVDKEVQSDGDAVSADTNTDDAKNSTDQVQTEEATAENSADQAQTEAITEDSTDQTQSEGSTQDSTGQSKPEGSTQDNAGQSKPEGSTQDNAGQTRPEGSTQDNTDQSKPEGSTQDNTDQSKPEGSTQDNAGQTRPEESTEDNANELEIESTAEDIEEDSVSTNTLTTTTSKMVLASVRASVSSEPFIVVDDNVTDSNQENYFTYKGGNDTSGRTGWSSTDARLSGSIPQIQTQHWVWNNSGTASAAYTYSFTFTGTGVELIGIKNDEYNCFDLNSQGAAKTQIMGTKGTEVVLYSVQNLKYGKHVVNVTLPTDGTAITGLQVSCAKVYGSKLASRVQTDIPYTKQDGEVNRFEFSPQGWTSTSCEGSGDSLHCWSDSPNNLPAGSIWYEVTFKGSQIDIWAGKNTMHGNVKYTIYEKDNRNTEVQTNTIVLRSSHTAPAMVQSFSGLDENKIYVLRAEALGTQGGNTKIIDCGKVVVYHQPYAVNDFTPTASYELFEGQTQQIEYTVDPSYAVVSDMQFVSNDPDVVSVDESTGLVRANKAGDAVITLSSATYHISKTVAIKVKTSVPQLDGSIVDIDSQYTDTRYQEVAAMQKVNTGTLTAWKNDKALSVLALISKDSTLKNVTVTASDLVPVAGGDNIVSSNIVATFIKSTKAHYGSFLGYGNGDADKTIPADNGSNRKDSSDILYQTGPMDMGWNDLQPVWLEFNIPKDAAAGDYKTTITVTAEGIQTPLTFTYTITVQNAILPDASTFKDGFSVDFWHHPYASAEYYDVVPFSDDHFKILQSIIDIYKEAGGDTIYTTIMEEPWKGQTYSKYGKHNSTNSTYPSMVRWTKRADGSFEYNYEHFDKWVEFCLKNGIGDKIVMFGFVPWHQQIRYYNESGQIEKIGYMSGGRYSQTYTDYFDPFIKDLIKHLESKTWEGKTWFERAYVGIDEQGFADAPFILVENNPGSNGETMKTMGYLDGITNADKQRLSKKLDFVSFGDFAVQDALSTYNMLLEERNQSGQKTTFYSCTEHRPGNFLLSEPVESYWSVVNAGSKGATGFARWAYDAWVPDPLEDTTNHSFEPGDCFVIYPDLKSKGTNAVSKSSVRLERMAEGVRDMNKVLLMLKEYPVELQPYAAELYATIQFEAYKNTKAVYLNENELTQLENEVKNFKTKLNEMTAKYIELGGRGSTAAAGNSGTVSASITDITITTESGNLAVNAGAAEKLIAAVNGTGSYNKTVTWELSGNSSNETTLTQEGLLTVAVNETAQTLTIKAIANGNNSISKEFSITINPTITSVTVTPGSLEVEKGNTASLTAEVKGTGNFAQTVTWTVEGNQSNKTTIADGVLTIGSDETAAALTVKAISTQDNQKNAVCTVTVKAAQNNQPSVTITGVVITPSAVTLEAGKTQLFTAQVSGTGNYDKTVSWKVEGAGSKTTAISTDGALTIGSDETAAILTIIAAAKGNSAITAKAAVTVKVAQSGDSGNTGTTPQQPQVEVPKVEPDSSGQYPAAEKDVQDTTKKVYKLVVQAVNAVDKANVDKTMAENTQVKEAFSGKKSSFMDISLKDAATRQDVQPAGSITFVLGYPAETTMDNEFTILHMVKGITPKLLAEGTDYVKKTDGIYVTVTSFSPFIIGWKETASAPSTPGQGGGATTTTPSQGSGTTATTPSQGGGTTTTAPSQGGGTTATASSQGSTATTAINTSVPVTTNVINTASTTNGVTAPSPKTGDNTPVAVVLIVLAGCIGVFGYYVYSRKKDKKN